MSIREIPEDKDGRMINSALGQRNRGATTRMSIDLTADEQKEFLLEAVEHNMTLRGYFYHCWRNSQKAEGLFSRTLNQEPSGSDIAEIALAHAKKRIGA